MDIEGLQTVADYQFGAGAGAKLLADDNLSLTRTSSGRPRQIHAPEGRLATYGTDGRFRLGVVGGQRLYEPAGPYTVAVGEESVPFVSEGRNAFAKFVVRADEAVRPGDEVIVEHEGSVLGVGRAELAGGDMADFETGVAVSIRDGIQ